MSWKWNIIMLGVIVVLLGALMWKKSHKPVVVTSEVVSGWRYVALGDSYSIGEGVSESERWPNILVERLKTGGVEIQLVGNPSRTGWTSQDLLDKELVVVAETKANFVTVQIGVNDFVQGTPPEIFRINLQKILERLKNQKVVLVTIPDFSKTPTGKTFGKEADLIAGVSAFNEIILDEGKKHGVPVVDIYPISQKEEKDFVAQDGLHPSGRQYEAWVEQIYPVAKDLLK